MKKILIVDDNAQMRRLLTITLNNDYEVIEACDGEDALAKIQNLKPDAVLLDVMMPGQLDGMQVLNVIKKDPLHVNTLVAMVTACDRSADCDFGHQLGADAYFIKPFSPLSMVRWLNEKLV